MLADTRVFRVTHRGKVSRLGRLVCDGLRLLLKYGFNKPWLRRIQPRLPERIRHPQWRVCLKFHYCSQWSKCQLIPAEPELGVL